ncbi:MAG: hypothetical protein ACOVOV_00535 [Dolichospermum sp.]
MKKEKLYVAQEFRTNPLSAAPGGSVVEVHYQAGIKVYDNIKNPKAYIKYIMANSPDVVQILVDGKPFNS